MGSIPPAASIEFPQREIVNTISDAGLTPTDTDLNQLAKAIQGGQLNFKHDTGTANAYAANMSPNPGTYFEGLGVVLRIGNSNTGASVLNLNSLGNKPIVRSDGTTALIQGDLTANALVYFLYDGTNFRVVWAQSAAIAGMPIYLQAPRVWYVNATTGSDSYDGTQATVGTGIHGPFKTLQAAANQIPLYNLNGYSVTIYVADGTYANVYVGAVNGSGSIFFTGNTSNPAACVIHGAGHTAVSVGSGCSTYFDGFKVYTDGTPSPADSLQGFDARWGGTVLVLGAIEFGPCIGSQIFVQRGALCSNKTPSCLWTISGGSPGSTWGFGAFLSCYATGTFTANSGGGPNINITAPASYAMAFVVAIYASLNQLNYNALTGAASVSGPRFYVSGNSSITTPAGGPNYYPGTVAGTANTSTGGYYT
jgi:hypothetical protein